MKYDILIPYTLDYDMNMLEYWARVNNIDSRWKPYYEKDKYFCAFELDCDEDDLLVFKLKFGL